MDQIPPHESSLQEAEADSVGISGLSLGDYDWAYLPEDILLMVLDITQEWGPRTFRGIALSISSACTNWKRIMDDHMTELQVKAVWNKPFEALMRRMPNLCTLKLYQAKDEVLELLSNYPRITHLDVRGATRVTSRGLGALRLCPWLRVLKLPDLHPIDNRVLFDLRANTSLEYLDMNGCDFLKGQSLSGLADMPNLQYLDLGDCSDIESDALCVLPLVTSLTSLNLTNVRGVRDDLLQDLCWLHELKDLNLQGCLRVTNTGIAALTKLPALQRLNLSQCSRISDECVTSLAQLTSLTDLDMSQCGRISETGVQEMCRLSLLKKLSISRLEVTIQGLQTLSRLVALEELDIRGCQIASWAGGSAFKRTFSATVHGP